VREGRGSEKWEKEMGVVRKLGLVAERLGTSRAGLGLAWVLRNQNVTSTIPGASRLGQVWASVRALDVVVELTESVVEDIEEILGNKPGDVVMRF
jgi:aryl-alcohol dehydrogenase-like predicted oxidoreductase